MPTPARRLGAVECGGEREGWPFSPPIGCSRIDGQPSRVAGPRISRTIAPVGSCTVRRHTPKGDEWLQHRTGGYAGGPSCTIRPMHTIRDPPLRTRTICARLLPGLSSSPRETGGRFRGCPVRLHAAGTKMGRASLGSSPHGPHDGKQRRA